MIGKYVTIETIESDIERLLEDARTLIDPSGARWSSKIKRHLSRRKDIVRKKGVYHDMRGGRREPNLSELEIAIEALACAIMEKTEEIEKLEMSADTVSVFKSDSSFNKGATGEEIMNALRSLPKLSDNALNAIEAGSKDMRDMPMPDSAWD
ncbi:MAG: hypothetical protein ACC657_01555 [Thiohalomonadales bacterium]